MLPIQKNEATLIGCLTGLMVMTSALILHRFYDWIPFIAVATGFFTRWLHARFSPRTTPPPCSTDQKKITPLIWLSVATIACLQVLLISLCLIHQTDAAISSPWQALPTTLFPLFTIALFLLLAIDEALPVWLNRILWAAQYLIAFGVSAFVYKLGFGFDPFIHQAAVRSLGTHHDIHLPSLLYVGQYALEGGLAILTHLSVSFIDRWLVPACSILLGVFSLPQGQALWRQSSSSTNRWLLFALPFLPLTFTVPYHLAYLCFFLIILLLPYLATKKGLLLAGLLLVTIGSFHPLLAIPAGVLVFVSFLAKKERAWLGLLAWIMTSIGLMGTFFVYVHTLGGTMVFPDRADVASALYTLFGFPYDVSSWPWMLSLAYRCLHLWPLFFAGLGWLGYKRSTAKETTHLSHPLLGTALGMLCAALFLVASTSFTNIISTEQAEFALRLRYAVPLLFFPGVLALVDRYKQTLNEKIRLLSFACAALFATGLWYTSYPQANTFIQTSAPGVSRQDIDTVQMIERLSHKTPYAALTPQMTSAAALSLIGFERELGPASLQRYPYAIPTGGILYQQYLRLWSEPDVNKILDTSRAITHESQIFIAIPITWDPDRRIHDRLAPLAQTETLINGIVTLYQFTE